MELPLFLSLRRKYGRLFHWSLKNNMSLPLQSLNTSSYICLIGHLHDDIILLLRPESFRVLLSCANLNLTGIAKFKCERKNEQDSGRSSKMTPSCWPIAKYFIPFRLLVSFIFTFTRVRQRAYHFVFLLMLADQ